MSQGSSFSQQSRASKRLSFCHAYGCAQSQLDELEVEKHNLSGKYFLSGPHVIDSQFEISK